MNGELILYTTEDGKSRIRLRAAGGTVWLTQREMAELFQTTSQNITLHIKAVYDEGELRPEATCKDDLQVRIEGNDRFNAPSSATASGRDVLDHLGSMSHDAALEKAEAEFEKYRQSLMLEKSPVEVHFEAAVKQLKTLDRKKTFRQPD